MLTKLVSIAREAGSAIMPYYNKNLFVSYKGDDSPLTQADLVSEEIITRRLRELFPEIPIVSEEGSHTIPGDTFFAVDPLDGSKEFLTRNGEFVVSIGFVKDYYPVCGVLYAPAFDQLYTSGEVRQAGKTLTMVASHHAPLLSHIPFIKPFKPIDSVLYIGSALKFAYVATGRADVYPRSQPLKIWDTCAGQAIVEAAGGAVCDWQGKRLRYDQLAHKGFVAYGKDVFSERYTYTQSNPNSSRSPR